MAKTPSRPVSSRPSTPKGGAPAKKGLSTGLIVVTLILVVLAGGAGYGATTLAMMFTQPLESGTVPTRNFAVADGDTLSSIGTHLEEQKFIRSATAFSLYIKVTNKKVDVQPGTYKLSPSMSMGQIINVLGTPIVPDEVSFRVGEGLRLTQFPDAIIKSAKNVKTGAPATLSKFDRAKFIDITVKGQPFDGLSKFWYVKPWALGDGKAYSALEGYLFPQTYQVLSDYTTEQIIKVMLKEFGAMLCPGPEGDYAHRYDYIYDETTCRAHSAKITPPDIPSSPAGLKGDTGGPTDVFAALDKNKLDIPKALILASLTQREARSAASMSMVASVYLIPHMKL
jgi:cell division protein YceG involved in septum cleavage